jgi:hypothetical protein
VEILFPHGLRDDEDRQFVGLSLGEIPIDREKAERSETHSRLSSVFHCAELFPRSLL